MQGLCTAQMGLTAMPYSPTKTDRIISGDLVKLGCVAISTCLLIFHSMADWLTGLCSMHWQQPFLRLKEIQKGKGTEIGGDPAKTSPEYDGEAEGAQGCPSAMDLTLLPKAFPSRQLLSCPELHTKLCVAKAENLSRSCISNCSLC